ncbi:MAG: hypothetical protein AB1351_07320 [Thermoproteota archaeon]
MRNLNLHLFLSIVAIDLMFFLVLIPNAPATFAQEQIDTSYIKAEIDVHGKSRLNNFTDGEEFARGETVNFYGYVDGYTQLENDSPAIFTVTITGPEKTIVLNQQFLAEEIGGQDIITFSYDIPESATFGIYEVSFIVEKQGHKTISQNTSDPDVGYSAPRFFVVWTEQDIIDVSDKYRLEIVEPKQGDKPIEFGTGLMIKLELCPSPIDNASNRGFYEPRSGHVVLDRDRNLIIVNAKLEPLDEKQAAGIIRNSTVFEERDGCVEHFAIPSGLLPASGKWSVSATAEWLDRNNATSLFRVQSETIIFEVAETLYRTNNIMRINLDDEKYPNALPMDWSADSKSILFKYQRSGEPAKLAVLHLDAIGNQTEASGTVITDLGNLTLAVDTTNPESYQSLRQARFGAGADGSSIYFVLDSGVYRYKIDQGLPSQSISINSSEMLLSNINSLIDIFPDGKIAYISNGKLMMLSSQSNGQNAKEIADIKDLYRFDISNDGKKVLYTKIIEYEYLRSRAVIAYYDIETGKEHIIPNIEITCEGGAQWAPNNYNFIFNDAACWRAPGGGLIMTDINGSFQDPIVPVSDDNPNHYVLSTDGRSILIGFGSYYEGQARDYMGSPADFYVMTLAQPVPEFGLSTIIPIIGVVTLAGMTLIRILRLQSFAK